MSTLAPQPWRAFVCAEMTYPDDRAAQCCVHWRAPRAIFLPNVAQELVVSVRARTL